MFALSIELLMRRAIITRWNDREEAEWPPHPDRVFMALVAAWGEAGEEASQKTSLEWLETLSPPAMAVCEAHSVRTPCTSYVPVNDDESPMGKKGPFGPLGTLAIGRNRQPRMFPTVVPEDATFYLIWNEGVPDEIRPLLEAVCAQVTYLGHSATPVRVGIVDSPPDATLVPNEDDPTHRLRVFGKGRLNYLIGRHAAGVRPQPSKWQGYGEPMEEANVEILEGPFDPAPFIFRIVPGPGSRRLGLEACGMVADGIRRVLMSRYGPEAPEWISGHAADSSQSRQDRPAYLPLGFVGAEHADGRLMGVGIAVPNDFAEVEELYNLICDHKGAGEDHPEGSPYMEVELRNPDFGTEPIGMLYLELDERSPSSRPVNLRVGPWTQPSAVWASVTPVVLPRFPKKNLSAEEIVVRACEESGYPTPVAVRVTHSPLMMGVPHSRSFLSRPQPGRPPRLLTHVEIEFPTLVRGPVLIGAGRYMGYGFFRPTLRTEDRT